MKKNMGTIDRIIRVLIAIIIFVLYITGTITGTLGIILLVLSIILLLTSFFSLCPIYLLLGISTLNEQKELETK